MNTCIPTDRHSTMDMSAKGCCSLRGKLITGIHEFQYFSFVMKSQLLNAVLEKSDLSNYDEADLLACLDDYIILETNENTINAAGHIAKYLKNIHSEWITKNISHIEVLYHVCINTSVETKVELSNLLLSLPTVGNLTLQQKWHLNRIVHNIEYIEYVESHPAIHNYLLHLPLELVNIIFQHLPIHEQAYFFMSTKGLYRRRSYSFKRKQLEGTCFIRPSHMAVSISRLLKDILNDHAFEDEDYSFLQSPMMELVDFTSNDNARETLLRVYRTFPDLFFIDFNKEPASIAAIGFPQDVYATPSKYHDIILESFIRNSRNAFLLLWNQELSRPALLKAMFYTTTGLEDALACGLNFYRHIVDLDEYLGMANLNCVLLENFELFFKLMNQFGRPLIKITELPRPWFDLEISHEYRKNKIYKKQIHAMFSNLLKYPPNLNFKVFSNLLRIVCIRHYDGILAQMVNMTNVPDSYFRDLAFYLCGKSLEMKVIAISATIKRPGIMQPEAREGEALVHALGSWDQDYAKYLCENMKLRQIIRDHPRPFLKRCAHLKNMLLQIKPSDSALLIFLKNEASRDDESEIDLELSDEESWEFDQ